MSDRLEKMIQRSIEKMSAQNADAHCYWFGGTWHSYDEMNILADACTDALESAGFTRGQRLVTLMPNCPETLALAVAVWRLGGSFCPLNEKSGAESLIKTLSMLRPFTIAASASVKAELLDEMRHAGYTCSVLPDDGTIPLFDGHEEEPDSDDIAVIFSTSGTTGDPKAVPITHDNLLNQLNDIVKRIPSLSSDDVFLNVLPNFHAFGVTASMILPLYLGASQAIVPGFMPPQNTLKAMIDARVTIALLVPAMLNFLTAMVERGGHKLPDIRLIAAGGDRYNISMDERVKNAFGTGIVEGYGITECSPVLSIGPVEDLKLGTVGKPLDSFELKLMTEDGTPAEGNEGVLWVRGPSVASGYYRAPEITSERFSDGWFNTGDFVSLEGGYIRVIDRVTDIIIVSGFNVYPQEVEAILSQHPAVQTAVVVGMPNSMSGEVPKAFIIKKEDAPESADIGEADIVKFCKEKLAHYKVPRSVEFVTELPMSPTGKVLRRVLRARERA